MLPLVLSCDANPALSHYVIAYLNERNTRFDYETFVFPYNFFSSISPSVQASSLDYHAVRNMTREYLYD